MRIHFLVDRTDPYTIEIRPSASGYTLHALSHPPNTRGGEVNQHHLYSSGQICVAAGHEPRTVERAKAVAMSWCEGWSKYIRGKQFPNGRKRVSVNS